MVVEGIRLFYQTPPVGKRVGQEFGLMFEERSAYAHKDVHCKLAREAKKLGANAVQIMNFAISGHDMLIYANAVILEDAEG